ncbi:MAG: porin family protein [Pseudomonadota bacterium]
MMLKKLVLLSALTGCSTFAAAQSYTVDWDNYYMGVQASQFRFDPEVQDYSDARPNVLSFAVGQQVNSHVAVEARLGFGVADDDLIYTPGGDTNLATEAETELDYALSVLLKPQLNLTEQLSLYALAGWSRAELSIAGESTADSGLSVGAGVSIRTTRDLAFYVDWLRLIDEDPGQLSGLNVGLQYRF